MAGGVPNMRSGSGNMRGGRFAGPGRVSEIAGGSSEMPGELLAGHVKAVFVHKNSFAGPFSRGLAAYAKIRGASAAGAASSVLRTFPSTSI